MKNKIVFQSVIVIVAMIVGVLIFKNKKFVAPLTMGTNDQAIDFSNPNSKPAAEAQTTIFRAQNTQNQKVVDVELKKCAPFLEFINGSALESAQQQIKANVQFQVEELEMTEYQIKSAANEEIIVQNNSNEEKKDQVRVFKMAKDGLPDRVKDFPNANLSQELKLEGALTLGRLVKKIEKYQAISATGANLFYEIEAGKLVRLSLTEGKKQLLCEELKCSCNEF